MIELLGARDLNAEEKTFLASLQARFSQIKGAGTTCWSKKFGTRTSVLRSLFFYFDDYYLLPGKVNLAWLSQRAQDLSKQDEEDKTVLSLLRMADVDMKELTETSGYEEIKSGWRTVQYNH